MEEQKIEEQAKANLNTAKELFKDQEDYMLAEEAISKNELEFEHAGVKYKVRKSTYIEKQEANKRRMVKYMELLKDKTYLLEKDLRKLYKDRGTDIAELDTELMAIEKQRQSLRMDLGKAIQDGKPLPELETYKKELLSLNTQAEEIQNIKNQLLEFSIENQVLIDVYSYLVYTVAEKFENNVWVKAWKSFEDFLSADASLIQTVTKYAALLIIEDIYGRT